VKPRRPSLNKSAKNPLNHQERAWGSLRLPRRHLTSFALLYVPEFPNKTSEQDSIRYCSPRRGFLLAISQAKVNIKNTKNPARRRFAIKQEANQEAS
jgi:hypothetical protein